MLIRGNGEENLIYSSLKSLPLMKDDLYMSMQIMNLAIVDEFIRDCETQLLHEYIEKERTPTESAMFVSAQSQLWIFGIYELLRTWRQRSKKRFLAESCG